MGRLPGMLVLAVFLACAAVAPAPGHAQEEAVVRLGTAVYSNLNVNIVDNGRLTRLHLGFEVQCTDEEGARLAASSQAREAIILFLREQKAADLMTARGKIILKDKLVTVINRAIGGRRAVRILFTQFVVI